MAGQLDFLEEAAAAWTPREERQKGVAAGTEWRGSPLYLTPSMSLPVRAKVTVLITKNNYHQVS